MWDFNVALNNERDTYNYKRINNPRAKKAILELMRDNELWYLQTFTPHYKEIHVQKKNPIKQARLDLFLASTSILDITRSCEIKASYRSDHSSIELELNIDQFLRGKGLWKFNNSLLQCEDYVKVINSAIYGKKLKYALPV